MIHWEKMQTVIFWLKQARMLFGFIKALRYIYSVIDQMVSGIRKFGH